MTTTLEGFLLKWHINLSSIDRTDLKDNEQEELRPPPYNQHPLHSKEGHFKKVALQPVKRQMLNSTQRESEKIPDFGGRELGRVRTEMIKKTARELLESNPQRFSADYEENKKAVDELVNAKTKRVRNRIAGYVTRLKIVENQKKSGTFAEAPLPPEESERE